MDISSATFHPQKQRDNVSDGKNTPDAKSSGLFQAEVDVQLQALTSGENVEKNSHSPASFAAPLIATQVNAVSADLAFDFNQNEDASENIDDTSVTKEKDHLAVVSSNHGQIEIDLDDYFSNEPKHYANLADVPLLLPSRSNLKVLSQHATERFQQLLKEFEIPEAPESISYNSEGRMILPNDYAYGNELKAALEQNTGLDRELRSLHAISSHVVELEKRMPFVEAMQLASSQAEIDRLIEKYSHLLNDNGDYSEVALRFSEHGKIGVYADGKQVQLG